MSIGLASVPCDNIRSFSTRCGSGVIGATAIHAGNGWVFSNANGGWEYPVMWAVVMAALAALGDGPYALSPSKRA